MIKIFWIFFSFNKISTQKFLSNFSFFLLFKFDRFLAFYNIDFYLEYFFGLLKSEIFYKHNNIRMVQVSILKSLK